MEQKFKLGDWIICPTAKEPTPFLVTEIDLNNDRYFTDNDTHSWIPFANEDLWVECPKESLPIQLLTIEREIKNNV